MNSIIASVRPPFAGWLMSGKKTVEIRKSRPMFNPFAGVPADGPVRVYIYETKTGGGAGAIVGRFDCRGFLEIRDAASIEQAAPAACLTVKEMEAYRGPGGALYGWQAVNAKRYKKPVPLAALRMSSAPQSWRWLRAAEIDALKGREKNNVLSSGRL